jgi:hypothetical protein
VEEETGGCTPRDRRDRGQGTQRRIRISGGETRPLLQPYAEPDFRYCETNFFTRAAKRGSEWRLSKSGSLPAIIRSRERSA